MRYYYASKLNSRAEDLDLNLGDFIQRVNTDLVNKIINILSRAIPLLHRLFEGKASALDSQAQDLIGKAHKVASAVEKYYLDNEPAHA